MISFKKVLSILFLASSIISTSSLIACNNNANDIPIDSDYDGLPDNIDPAPNDNQYDISLHAIDESLTPKDTNSLPVRIDYRNFIDTNYHRDLALLSAYFTNEVNGHYAAKVHNNVYPSTPTEQSKLYPLLAQMGAQDIMVVQLGEIYKNEDKYDVANLVMGHHTFAYNNKVYQVFIILVKAYARRTGWISNFDLGAVDENGNYTEAYKELEGDNHPDWLFKYHHKGFDVTANRAFAQIKKYQSEHIRKGAHIIDYCVGHSRGGSLVNLIGKRLIDDDQEVRSYGINPAATTLNLTTARNKKYKTLFNIMNKTDLVSHIPDCGFTHYGTEIYLDTDASFYNEFFRHERTYQSCSSEAIEAIVNFTNYLLTKNPLGGSRNNFYEIREPSLDIPEKRTGTKAEMEEQIKTYSQYFPKNPYSKKCFIYDTTPRKEGDEYAVYYYTRPAILKGLMVDYFDKRDTDYLTHYIMAMYRIIEEWSAIQEKLSPGEFSLDGVRIAHEEASACALVANYNPEI